MPRDIRGDTFKPQGPVLGSDGDNLSWSDGLEPDENAQSLELKTRVGMTGADPHKPLINPNTNQPFGVPSTLVHNQTVIENLWQQKMMREPCFACASFKDNAVTREEKAYLWHNLVKEHGLSKNAVRADLGNPENFGYCEIYNSLTHKTASCPKYWRPRKSWLTIFRKH